MTAMASDGEGVIRASRSAEARRLFLEASTVYLAGLDWGHARKLVTQAIRCDPSCLQAYVLKGRILIALGNDRGAKDILKQVLARSTAISHPQEAGHLGNDTSDARVSVYLLMGRMAIIRGSNAEAAQAFESAIREGEQADPELHEEAYDAKIELLVSLGNQLDAEAVVMQGLRALAKRGVDDMVLLNGWSKQLRLRL